MKKLFVRIFRSLGWLVAKETNLGSGRDYVKFTWSGEAVIVIFDEQDLKFIEVPTRINVEQLLGLERGQSTHLGGVSVERIRRQLEDEFTFRFNLGDGGSPWIRINRKDVLRLS